jgi:hypothetical protein
MRVLEPTSRSKRLARPHTSLEVRRNMGMARKVIVALAATIITLLGLEVSLWALGFTPDYSGDSADDFLPARWWICDDLGCRFDRSYLVEVPADRTNPNLSRMKIVNHQGFHDQDEFVHSDELEDVYRILVLGDSFTWGASADIGRSWVEIVEAGVKNRHRAIVWNTAIPGAGTKQEIITLKKFVPIMEPDLVLLGFHTNDFSDNLYPLDMYMVTASGKWVLRYEIDSDLVPVKSSPRFTHLGRFGYLLLGTRLGTLARRGIAGSQVVLRIIWSSLAQRAPVLSSVDPEREEKLWEKETCETEVLLREIRDYVSANEIDLLVLLIPGQEDIRSPGRKYLAAQQIMRDLSIEFIDLRSWLGEEDYNLPPDIHWNNGGHSKAGEVVLDHILPLIE